MILPTSGGLGRTFSKMTIEWLRIRIIVLLVLSIQSPERLSRAHPGGGLMI